MTEAQRDALNVLSDGNTILMPWRGCKKLTWYFISSDGRLYQAPPSDAAALFDAGFIDERGEITHTGRVALTEESWE